MKIYRTYTRFDAHVSLVNWAATQRGSKLDRWYWQRQIMASLRDGNARLYVTPRLP